MNPVHPDFEQMAKEQRASYTALLNSLGAATFDKFQSTLARA